MRSLKAMKDEAQAIASNDLPALEALLKEVKAITTLVREQIYAKKRALGLVGQQARRSEYREHPRKEFED